MLFLLIKLYARFCIKIYCRKIIVNKPDYLRLNGPVLFAANHPNSFLDGIILTTLLEENLYSLARGDAFKQPRVRKLLHWMHLLPVYRTSEGVENLGHNYTTFNACHEVFAAGGQVMIFSEGRCINEWHLRPLKKGTARLAISTWEKGIDLTVIPVGFNYNQFRNFGKNVFINFGKPVEKEAVLREATEGKQLLQFNEQIETQLKELVFEIDKTDRETLQQKVTVPQPLLKKVLLAPLALVGWVLHAPLYYSAKAFTKAKFDNDHFDSVVAAVLMLGYPLYVIILLAIGSLLGGIGAFWLLVLLPLSAWACVQLKPQLN